MNDCFPPWLKRQVRDAIGPPIPDPLSYPVYQVQPGVLSQSNPNGNQGGLLVSDSFFQSFANRIASANVATSVVEVFPNNVYDTVIIVAFDDALTGAKLVPIFFSLDKPGRVNAGTMTASSVTWPNPQTEVNLWTTGVFDPSDFSGYPNCVIGQQVGLTNYSTQFFDSVKTNRPFYVWFSDNDGTGGGGHRTPLPAGNAAFKISWYVRGR